MKHIYLFNEGSRASVYGIGTYIRQLMECLKDEKDISLNIIQLFSDEKEFKIVESEGYRTFYFPGIHTSTSQKVARYYRNIWRLLSEYLYLEVSDQLIFHMNYFSEYPLIELMKKDYSSCKVLFTIHYQDWAFALKGNTSYFKRIIHSDQSLITDKKEKSIVTSYEEEKKMLQAVDHIICLAKYTQNLLIEEYDISKEKTSLIYNGLKDEAIILSKEEKAALKRQLFISEEEKIILFVGRLDEIKGLDVLIKAFKQIVEKEPHCRLVIVGDGNFPVYLKEGKGYWNKMTFTGRLEKEELYKFYQIADVGVLPSMHEQCSYVAIEMMMFDIPIIVSTTTGLCEMATDKENRIDVIEEKDSVAISSESLSESILRKLTKRDRQGVYRQIYSDKYTIDNMCRSLLKRLNYEIKS
jgi:glycosyltransferase